MAAQPAYTAREIAESTGLTVQAIRKRARLESWLYTKRPGRGGGKQFNADDTPADIQAAVALHEAKRAAQQAQLTCYYQADKNIPEKARHDGIAKMEILGAWKNYRQKAKPKKKADTAFLAAYNSGQSHPSIFEKLGTISRSRLFRWDRRLKESDGDWRILCDHRGWGPAAGLQGNIGSEAEAVFLKIYLTPQRPSAALSYRAMCAVLGDRGQACPSMRSTYRFIERYNADNADHVALMRDGEKALADKIGPYIDRASHILEVGDVLIADGHRLNFDCIHPFTGRPARMTLILWQDWASRLPLGWEIMPEENTIAIASALRMAIIRLGKIPKVAYIDNGKAFRSKYFNNTPVDQFQMETRGLFSRLKIGVQYSRPYQARTKIIERFFGTFDAQCARLLPTHRGSSVADKPAYLMRNEKFHRARQSGQVPSVEDALEIFEEWVRWHGQQPHRGLNGGLPIEKFLAGRGRGVDTKQLDYTFMWRKEVRPRRCRIRLAGIDFESDALYGLDQPIIVYYAWNDFSQIHMYVKRTRQYIGVARPVSALHPVARHLGTDFDLTQVAEANKRQAKLKKQTMVLARQSEAPEEALKVLPWIGRATERVPIEVDGIEPAAPEPIEVSDAERRAIKQVQIDYEARQAAAPPYERPDFFKPLERYSHLFNLRTFEGIDLLPEDAAFMAEYEAGDEYQKSTHGRFDQLLELRAAQLEPETEEEATT